MSKINRDVVGLEAPPFEMAVEGGKIGEFARATHADNPAYRATRAAVSPPTFLETMRWWRPPGTDLWDGVPLDRTRSLHSEQTYEFRDEPPRAGTLLTCRSSVEDVFEKHGRRSGRLTFVVVTTDFVDPSGEVVARAKMTGVEPERVSGPGGAPPPDEPEPGGSDDSPAPLLLPPVTRTDFVRYQGASGDMNPIHHDEEWARSKGFPSVFAPGMFQAGILAGWAAGWLGPHNVRRFSCRFLEPVWPGDTLECSGRVTRSYEEIGEQRVDADLECRRGAGRLAVRGWATFVAP